MSTNHVLMKIQIQSEVVERESVGTVTAIHIWFVIVISHDAKSGARRRATVLACLSVILVSRTPNGIVVEF